LNRKRRATPFGAGYTEYQPNIIFLDLFRGKNVLFVEPLVKPQNTKVLLNLYRQPFVTFNMDKLEIKNLGAMLVGILST